MQYLYLIKCQEYYKIGVAVDVENRLAQLSTGNPYPLSVEVYYEFENADVVERVLHQKYKNCRVRGEWFDLSRGDISDIHAICLILDGSPFKYSGESVSDDAVKGAEEYSKQLDVARFDYAAMFSAGWSMYPSNSKSKKDYWVWRKRISGEPHGYLYGGRIVDLPYPDLEAMRRVYRDGLVAPSVSDNT